MKIMINGENHDVDKQTLAELLNSLGHESTAVATALNGVFVPLAERESNLLQAEDAVEIIAPMAGG